MTQRNYPMLESCRVVIRPENGIDKPPVRLPADCLETVEIPKPYDFALERSIVKKNKEREKEWALTSCVSREQLQQNVVSRMKSVTNADEDTCVALLESNSYDLGVSIEAYLSTN